MHWGSNHTSNDYCTDTESCVEEIDMDCLEDDFHECSNFGEASDERPNVNDKEVHDVVDSKEEYRLGAPSSFNALANAFNPKLRLNSIKKDV